MDYVSVTYYHDNGGKWFNIAGPYKELSLDEVDARRVAHKILAHLGAAPPSASTPLDPALILADEKIDTPIEKALQLLRVAQSVGMHDHAALVAVATRILEGVIY